MTQKKRQRKNHGKGKKAARALPLCFLLIRVSEMTSDNRRTAFSARGGGYFCK